MGCKSVSCPFLSLQMLSCSLHVHANMCNDLFCPGRCRPALVEHATKLLSTCLRMRSQYPIYTILSSQKRLHDAGSGMLPACA
ncbi:hypothetical protein IWX50DRAFT_644901 [Phyllosticta citricarpa]|uniref:Secreted protein n=1 Tax=Phyllosticta citricarpa TaxID=55181 RepID=A0ABR1LK46_9PEZI